MASSGRSGDFVDEATRWYASQRGMTIFTEVPVTRPDWRGWGSGCWERLATVAVEAGEPGTVEPFGEQRFEAALGTGAAARPLRAAKEGAGRYIYGDLATQRAFLERSWKPTGPVNPCVLVPPGADRPNTASAFQAAGIEIVAMDGDAPPRGRRGRGWTTSKDPWDNPEPGEDILLQELWNSRGRAGWWLAEVPIGCGAPRRIDAVSLPSPTPRHSREGVDIDELREVLAVGSSVELIEVKRVLNEQTVGQLLAAVQMFSEEYAGHGELTLTACVRDAGDEALDWFCAQNGIQVERVGAGLTPAP